MSRGTRHLQGRIYRQGVARAKAQAAATAERAKGQYINDMRAALTEVRISMYGLPDGDRSDKAVHLLSHLAWLIGMGAELGFRLQPAGPEARRLHGALRQVVDLCLQGRGYTWRTEHAVPLERAAADSHELLLAHAEIALQMLPGADYLSNRVRSRTLIREDVAGAEIYRAAA
jgi:hypothetical protein